MINHRNLTDVVVENKQFDASVKVLTTTTTLRQNMIVIISTIYTYTFSIVS